MFLKIAVRSIQNMFHIILFLIAIFLFIKLWLYVLKNNFNLGKKHYNQLKKENKIDGFFDYSHYLKELNPWGGFVSPETMRKNLLKNNDSKEIEVIVNEMFLYNKEVRKRFKVLIVLFIIIIVNSRFNIV